MAIELTTATAETLSGIREALSIPTKPAKDEADVLNLESYGPTIHGPGYIGNISQNFQDDYRSKFQYVEQEGGELNFSVLGGMVNGSPICPSILGDLSSTTVSASNMEGRDDGHGWHYSNYISYLRQVFERLGLNSTLSGSNSNGGVIFMKYYRSESFHLIFKQVFTDAVGRTYTTYWSWQTLRGLGVFDSYSNTNPNIYGSEAFLFEETNISPSGLWSGSLFQI